MKAEKKKSEFQPVIVTLENEEEADLLWCLLNQPADEVQTATERVGFDDQAVTDVHCDMRDAFETVHRPTELDDTY